MIFSTVLLTRIIRKSPESDLPNHSGWYKYETVYILPNVTKTPNFTLNVPYPTITYSIVIIHRFTVHFKFTFYTDLQAKDVPYFT